MGAGRNVQTRRFAPRSGRFLTFGGLLWPGTRIPDGHRPLRRSRQASTDEVEIGRRAGDEQAMSMLLKAPGADLGDVEDALDDAEGMLDAAADLGLDDTVRGPLDFVSDALVAIAAVGEAAGLRRRCSDHRP